MCYAGGPYCDKNVKPRLDKAINDYRNNKTAENLRKAHEVRDEWDSTPKGQEELQEKIDRLIDNGHDFDVIEKFGDRLEKAKARRAKDMQDYKKREAQKKISKGRLSEDDVNALKAESFPFASQLSLKEVGSAQLSPPYEGNLAYYVDYDYDRERDPVAHSYCEDEGICRCERIVNGKVMGVYEDQMVSAYVSNYNSLVPAQQEEIKAIFRANNAFNYRYYEVSGKPGYYGEEVAVEFENDVKLIEDLKLYMISSPNAADEQGILPYMRSKDIDTSNQTPKTAVREYLTKFRNEGRVPRYLKKSSKVNVENVNKDKITFSKGSTGKDSTPVTPPKGIAGILVKQGDSYTVVDGENHVSGLKRNEKRKKARFIVIEN